jgi:uncharacterized protein (TIGR02118 family)
MAARHAVFIIIIGKPSDQRTPKLIKVIMLGRRAPDLSRDEFHAYWRDHHGPRVIGSSDFMRYVRKYTRNYLFEDPAFPSDGRWDALVEFWFDSVEDARAAFAGPGYTETIRPDEYTFGDLTAEPFVLLATEETYPPEAATVGPVAGADA